MMDYLVTFMWQLAVENSVLSFFVIVCCGVSEQVR